MSIVRDRSTIYLQIAGTCFIAVCGRLNEFYSGESGVRLRRKHHVWLILCHHGWLITLESPFCTSY